MNLNFKGPFHFDYVQSINDINSPGIYIWGFTAKKNANGIDYDIDNCKLNPQLKPNGSVDLVNGQVFIPYYVGIASGGSGVYISSRIFNHHRISCGNGLKYTRLTKGYLKNQVSQTSIDKLIKNSSNFTIQDVSYFNNFNFLKAKYSQSPFCYKNNYPIDLQIANGISIYDSLEEFVNKRNNFSFLFVSIEEDGLQNLFGNATFKVKLSFLESFVFYSLKGITISNCHVLSTLKNKIAPQLIKQNTSLIQLSAPNCNDIFKITDTISFVRGNPSVFSGNY